ncbi:hypothetical protein Droror1_Dr00026776 [Drosera rotundifolia]
MEGLYFPISEKYGFIDDTRIKIKFLQRLLSDDSVSDEDDEEKVICHARDASLLILGGSLLANKSNYVGDSYMMFRPMRIFQMWIWEMFTELALAPNGDLRTLRWVRDAGDDFPIPPKGYRWFGFKRCKYVAGKNIHQVRGYLDLLREEHFVWQP